MGGKYQVRYKVKEDPSEIEDAIRYKEHQEYTDLYTNNFWEFLKVLFIARGRLLFFTVRF